MSIRGLGEAAERVRQFTVLVEPGGRGSGSGVLWSSDGLIVTNAHVARSPRALVTLWDGREFDAQVTVRDRRLDLAALRISEVSAYHRRDSRRRPPACAWLTLLGAIGRAAGSRKFRRTADRRGRPRHRHQLDGGRPPGTGDTQQRRAAIPARPHEPELAGRHAHAGALATRLSAGARFARSWH